MSESVYLNQLCPKLVPPVKNKEIEMMECASKIVTVCVYPGQAQIVRRGRVELPAGPGEVVLSDIPLSLQPETVRVAGRGTARVRLLGVEVGRAHYAQPPEKELLALDHQIERLEDQDRALALQIEALEHRLEVLAGLGTAAAERMPWGVSRGTADVTAVEGLLQFAYKAEAEVREEVRKLEVKRRDLERKLESLRRERDDRAQPYMPDRYAVRVPVEVESAGDLELELTYVCQGATWAPLYDLRLDEKAEGGPQVTLGQLAEVSQQTGEDWDGVELSVSTARPALAARLPELSPWYVDLYRPRPQRMEKMRAAAAPAPGAFAMAEEAPMIEMEDQEVAVPPPEPQPAAVAVAEVRAEGPAIAFVAPGAPSIPADGSPHKIFLGSQVFPAPLDWITAPKVEAHVYRRAKVQNTSPAILLPGKGSLFYGDTFIGTTAVPETPPQAEFEAYLGVDEQMKVEREMTDRTVEKGGIIGQVRRMQVAYRVLVHSYRAERVPLTVLDQLPVSRNEGIKVKLLHSEPSVEPGEMGELRWEFSLAAGEERPLAFELQIDMPLEGQVVGLP
jgi:uncharacterized protein (TIGR02231 family)